MRRNVQAINFSIKTTLKEYISKRIDKYQHYYSKILSTDFYMKLENSSHKKRKLVEIKIQVPGDTFVVKKESSSFEEAIDMASNAVERLLIRRKEKQLRSFQNGV